MKHKAVWQRSTPFVTCGSNSRLCRALALAIALLWPGLSLAQGSSSSAPAQSTSGISDASNFSASLGASAWHGDFGAPTNTDIWSVLLGARYRVGGLRLSASLPRMHVRSDGTFFAGLGGTPLFVAPNVAALKRRRTGFGDLTVGAAYLISNLANSGFDMDLSGRIKIRTATKASQLSTRKVDYSAGAELSRTMGRITPSISATYRVYGDAPPWRFRNGFDLTAGATYALGQRSALVATYEYREAATRFIPDSHELILGASSPLTDKLRLTGYGSAGLSKGASDLSGGISLSIDL